MTQVHLVVRLDPETERKLDQVFDALPTLMKIGHKIMAALDDLKAAVARDTDVDASAITLLQGLKASLDAAIASGDPAALTALSTQLGQNTDALAAAVTANTPTPPAPAA